MLARDCKVTAFRIDYLPTGASIVAIANDYRGAAGAEPVLTYSTRYGAPPPKPPTARGMSASRRRRDRRPRASRSRTLALRASPTSCGRSTRGARIGGSGCRAGRRADGHHPGRGLVMKSAKRKGTRNEHRSRVLLEAAGYCVTRAAGSLGAWDLIGVGSVDVVLVQCKTRDWPGLVEMETLRAFKVPPNCRRLVHRWRDRQRVPEVREL